MSIRSVGVRQDTGAYHIIPRSSITTFANFVRGIGSVVANYDVDRHEDLDKASRALKAAVDDLLARGGDPRSDHWRTVVRRAGGAEQYRLYATRQLHHPAAEAVDGAFCPRHPGEKALRPRRGSRAGTDRQQLPMPGADSPAAE